jgi:Carboxypeptidase regulatory-like domain
MYIPQMSGLKSWREGITIVFLTVTGTTLVRQGKKSSYNAAVTTFPCYRRLRNFGGRVRKIQSCVYRLFFLVFAVCTCVASVSLAQTSKGSISGTVTDHSGAVVAGAQVRAMNDSLGGEQRIVTTDGEGKYLILTLDPGVYTLEISGTGFSSLKIDRVEVKGSVISTVNAVLEIGKITDTVSVEASAGQELQTTSGELSNTISRKEVGELPILGLNAISLVLTEPGVIQPSSREDFTNGVGFSVNGTRPRGTTFCWVARVTTIFR